MAPGGAPSTPPTVVYRVAVQTSDVKDAGTDAKVCVTLHGAGGSSAKLALGTERKADFERCCHDVFSLPPMPSLGELVAVDVEHDGTGWYAGWHLDYLEVTDTVAKRRYHFPCGQWLDKTKEPKLTKQRLPVLELQPNRPTTDYRVKVHTADELNAGTDAKVFITITGVSGASTGWLRLTDSRDNFERNRTEHFMLRNAPNVGPIATVTVMQDGTGMGASWKLGSVEVLNVHTDELLKFPADIWLDKSREPKKLEVTLQPVREAPPRPKPSEPEPAPAPMPAPTPTPVPAANPLPRKNVPVPQHRGFVMPAELRLWILGIGSLMIMVSAGKGRRRQDYA